jgi:hypothetical protein
VTAAAPIVQTPEYVLRSATPGDEPLIYSAWIKGAYEAWPARLVRREVFFEQQKEHIRRCLDRSYTVVMCHPDDPRELFGFVCHSGAVSPRYDREGIAVHWFYVRNMFRRCGIARSVARRLNITHAGWLLVATQESKHSEWIRKKTGAVYDPFFCL